MKIFTIEAGSVRDNAEVTALTLASGVKIPVVTVGEEGRGRKLGVLPISLLPKSQAMWDYEKKVHIENVLIGETRSGRPKLIEAEPDSYTDHAVMVLKTPAGFRGSNQHGAKLIWKLHADIWSFLWEGEFKTVTGRFKSDILRNPVTEEIFEQYSKAYPNAISSQTGRIEDFVENVAETAVEGSLPGQTIASGQIAQGAAGRAGSGEQFVVIMPRDTTWAVKMTGRLYGRPSSYEYVFDGTVVTAYTARDLELMD
jgi:hypothetical protein